MRRFDSTALQLGADGARPEESWLSRIERRIELCAYGRESVLAIAECRQDCNVSLRAQSFSSRCKSSP